MYKFKIWYLHLDIIQLICKTIHSKIKFFKSSGHLPKDLATARNGTLSMGVLLLTGPMWPGLGRFHTTRCTPALLATAPPSSSIRFSSSGLSGLCS